MHDGEFCETIREEDRRRIDVDPRGLLVMASCSRRGVLFGTSDDKEWSRTFGYVNL